MPGGTPRAVGCNCMKLLIVLYSFLLILFCLSTTFLILSSPHHLDKDLLVFNSFSLLIFPATILLLNKTYDGRTKAIPWTFFSLILTGLILIYYLQDLLTSVDGISRIILFPISLLVLTIFFVVVIMSKRNKAKVD